MALEDAAASGILFTPETKDDVFSINEELSEKDKLHSRVIL
jgi:hypothetical protein